jgi:hypothetical protein
MPQIFRPPYLANYPVDRLKNSSWIDRYSNYEHTKFNENRVVEFSDRNEPIFRQTVRSRKNLRAQCQKWPNER